MKHWPKKFVIKILKHFLLVTLAIVGIRTIIENFLFNGTETKSDIVVSIIFGFIMSLVFIVYQGDKWKTKLEKYRRKESKPIESEVQ